MIDENRLPCIFCEEGKRAIDFTESNKNFLSNRVKDGNIEAITISRMAWDIFPTLRESADTKKIAETILLGLQQTINEQIAPTFSGLNALISTLEKNPELIQKCSNDATRDLSGQINQIKSSINGPATLIQEIHQMLSQLVYNPLVKGKAGEQILADIWPQYFGKDQIERLGGAGKEDFLVTPYLNNGIAAYGDRISIERKSGKQRYTGTHLNEAIRHAMEKGAPYSIVVYDTPENLPQKTMFDREKDVLVAVVDLQSGTWKMAREIFEVIQEEVISKRKTVNEINMKVIQEVASDIGTLLKYTSNIRGDNTKIQKLTDKIEENANAIKDAVANYQSKLKSAVTEIENATPITNTMTDLPLTGNQG